MESERPLRAVHEDYDDDLMHNFGAPSEIGRGALADKVIVFDNEEMKAQNTSYADDLVHNFGAPSEIGRGALADQVVVFDNGEMGARNTSHASPFFRCFEIPLHMAADSQQGSRGVIFPQSVDVQWQGDEESAKAMNADLYRCLQTGQIDALKRMLEDEEDSFFDQVTPQQNTPLHIVARLGHEDLVKLLLARRCALLTQTNMSGEFALHLAAEAGHVAVVRSILEVCEQDLIKEENKDGGNALHVAVRHKHEQVAQCLIRACPEASFCLNVRLESPLFLAAELGELELVKVMIEAPVTADVQSALEQGKSVVHAAISGGRLGVLEAILSKHQFLINLTEGLMDGEDVRVLPLSYAAFKGNIRMVRYLLTQCPDHNYKRDPSGTFPIHVAATKGHTMVVEELLRFHPDSKELVSFGRNILHMAAFHGQKDTVCYILSKPNLDELINVRDHKGNTALHYAVHQNHPLVVDALTWDKRVKLDLVNGDGLTAMDMALNYQNPMPSFKEQLTWLALRYAGAPRKRSQRAEGSEESAASSADSYKDRVNTLSVVATLAATMSFAAGFTMPGGNDDLGTAKFLKRRVFQLFVMSNSVSLYTSVLDVLVLIFAMLGDITLLRLSLRFAVPLLAISIGMMSVSFMSAAYLMVSTLKWLGIVVWVLGSFFLAALLALFVVLSPPMAAMNRLTRYVPYVPFRAMVYICEWK